jgi:hypothetical protein
MSAGYLGVLCAIMLVAASPLLRRFYLDRIWVHPRGKVIRLDGATSTNPNAAGVWVWTPIIEYHAAGHRLSGQISCWQRFNAQSKYAVGDKVDTIYNPRDPSRVMLDSWTTDLFLTILLGSVIAIMLSHQR